MALKDDGRILVRPKAWQRLWTGLALDEVKKQLLGMNLLIAGRNGIIPSVEKVGGKAARFYVLSAAFVDGVTT